jgi:hypothetical protein
MNSKKLVKGIRDNLKCGINFPSFCNPQFFKLGVGRHDYNSLQHPFPVKPPDVLSDKLFWDVI